MTCPYCAEEIKDEAVVCRFCSAVKDGGKWRRPEVISTTQPFSFVGSRFTIRTTGAVFLLSAMLEGLSVSSPVPLFGNVRSGVVAVVYHLLYVGLFLGMGVGLWAAKSWGYRFVCAGTVFFTLERILYLLDGQARAAETTSALGSYTALLGADVQSSVAQAMALSTVLTIACWWGFLLYLYFRRDYFQTSEK